MRPWRHAEQLRCGLCDEQIAAGEPTRHVDDERCHASCAHAYLTGQPLPVHELEDELTAA